MPPLMASNSSFELHFRRRKENRATPNDRRVAADRQPRPDFTFKSDFYPIVIRHAHNTAGLRAQKLSQSNNAKRHSSTVEKQSTMDFQSVEASSRSE